MSNFLFPHYPCSVGTFFLYSLLGAPNFYFQASGTDKWSQSPSGSRRSIPTVLNDSAFPPVAGGVLTRFFHIRGNWAAHS